MDLITGALAVAAIGMNGHTLGLGLVIGGFTAAAFTLGSAFHHEEYVLVQHGTENEAWRDEPIDVAALTVGLPRKVYI